MTLAVGHVLGASRILKIGIRKCSPPSRLQCRKYTSVGVFGSTLALHSMEPWDCAAL